MDKNVVVNIGRQYGSGGHEIGKRLAKKINVPFYDNEIIAIASKESGIKEELFKVIDEQHTNSFLYSLVMGASPFSEKRISAAGTVSMSDRLYLIQNDIIKKIANESSCVIVGRCSDYILKGKEKIECVNIFVHSDIKNRIKKAEEETGYKGQEAIDFVAKVDKKRASYYSYYTDKKWNTVSNWDLSIDSGILGIDNCVDLIIDYMKIRFKD